MVNDLQSAPTKVLQAVRFLRSAFRRACLRIRHWYEVLVFVAECWLDLGDVDMYYGMLTMGCRS